MLRRALIIIAAYVLDSILGDPTGYPHPVKIYGKFAEILENRVRKSLYTPVGMTLGGTGIALSVTGGAYLTAKLLLRLPCSELIEIILLYTTVARKDLAGSASRVAGALESGDIENARRQLTSLVGRDTDDLDESAIARAVVESIGENFVDGVLSPLMWAAAGGAPAALSYKAASTLDSMYGHRNYKFRYLGKFSARADDLSNWFAARISVPIISVASLMCGFDAWSTLRVGIRDRLKHDSPNSAHGEAAFAGALGLKLGGPGLYHGIIRNLPEIGDGTGNAGSIHIRKAIKLMNAASNLGLVAVLIVMLLWRSRSVNVILGRSTRRRKSS